MFSKTANTACYTRNFLREGKEHGRIIHYEESLFVSVIKKTLT